MRTLALLLVLCATLLIVAGCGSDDAPPTSTMPVAKAERAEPTQTPLPPTTTTLPTPTTVPATATTTTMTPTQTPLPPTTTTLPTPTTVPATATTLPTSTSTAVSTPLPEVAADDTPPSALADEAFAFLEALTEDHSPRASATDQELAAAHSLVEHLEEMGYRTYLQDFTVDTAESSEVIFSSDTATAPDSVESSPMEKSSVGVATGLLADAGMAFAEDIPADGLDGKVALIERGTITFEEKVQRVAEAGAIAAIIFNKESGLFRGTFYNPSTIPALAIARETGLELLDLIGRAEVEATVSVTNISTPSRNVVAEKPGESDGESVVIVGAHYDTVPDVDGANDNGSGTTAVITTARHIADREYPFTVKFILFGSEELGLHGSRHYVSELTETERSNIIAVINMDVVGSGNTLEILGANELTETALDVAFGIDAAISRSSSAPTNIGSDHVPFIDAGIPAVFIASNDASRIHTSEDTLEFIDPNLIGWAIEISIALLDHFASNSPAP